MHIVAQIKVTKRKSLCVQHVFGLLLGVDVGLLAFRFNEGRGFRLAIIVCGGVHYVVYYRVYVKKKRLVLFKLITYLN